MKKWIPHLLLIICLALVIFIAGFVMNFGKVWITFLITVFILGVIYAMIEWPVVMKAIKAEKMREKETG